MLVETKTPPNGPWNGKIPEGWEKYEGPRIPGLWFVYKSKYDYVWEAASLGIVPLDQKLVYIRHKSKEWVYKRTLANGEIIYSHNAVGEKPKYVFHNVDGEIGEWVEKTSEMEIKIYGLLDKVLGKFVDWLQGFGELSAPNLSEQQKEKDYEWVELVPKKEMKNT